MNSFSQRRIATEYSGPESDDTESPGCLWRWTSSFDFQEGGRHGRGSANGSGAHFVREVLSFAVYSGVEEFAERVEEKDPGQHTGENLELRIVMLQMHEFVSDHRIGLLEVEKGQETARQEDASLFPPHGQRDNLIRFDQTNVHGWDTFEFSQPIDVLLNPRLFLGKSARREPPNHGSVPEPPNEHGDRSGDGETPNHRPEDRERNPVP